MATTRYVTVEVDVCMPNNGPLSTTPSGTDKIETSIFTLTDDSAR